MAVSDQDLLYPFDPTGTRLSNRIEGEQQIITPPDFRDFYFIIPKVAPFFADSLEITFKGLDNENRTLIEGVDYYLSHWFLSASRACAKPIYGSISFLYKDLNGVVTLKYQTIGGVWTLDEAKISELLANVARNPRTTTWDTIVDMPIVFPVIDHEWDLVDMVGASDMVEAIDRIVDVLGRSGENAITEHIANKENPHEVTKAQVGLGLVENYPIATVQQAQDGISNVVYMTSLRTKNAIDKQAGDLVNLHANNQANPHNVTAAQLGLGNVQNYVMATNAEAINGALFTRYMSPANTKAVMDAFATGPFASHVNNKLNPHEVDKVQVGLGNVENYRVATADEARGGSINTVYMTPLRVRQAIQALAGNEVSEHVARQDNPHNTTKAQVGLGNVQNYGTATETQTIEGTATNLYVTPKGVAAAIGQIVGSAFTDHVNDLNNPHKVTAAQVGAYSFEQINNLLSFKLGIDQEAADSRLFGGMNVDQYADYARNGKVLDTWRFDGLDSTEFRNSILSGQIADSVRFDGRTYAEFMANISNLIDSAEVDNATRFGGMGVEQYKAFVLEGKAADSDRLNNLTYEQLMDNVLALFQFDQIKVLDTFRFDGRTPDDYKTWVLSDTAYNSDRLGGRTYAEIMLDISGQIEGVVATNALKFNDLDSDEYKAFVLAGTAANAAQFNNLTYEQLMDNVLALFQFDQIKVLDTFRFDGRTSDEYRDYVLGGQAADSARLDGMTVEQIVDLAGDTSGIIGQLAKQVFHGEFSDENPDATHAWLPFFDVPLSAVPGEDVVLPSIEFEVVGGDGFDVSVSQRQRLKVVLDGNAASPIALVVTKYDDVPGYTPEFGYTYDQVEGVLKLWLKTSADRRQVTVTELTKGLGDLIELTFQAESEPVGIVYATDVRLLSNASTLGGEQPAYYAKQSDMEASEQAQQTLATSIQTVNSAVDLLSQSNDTEHQQINQRIDGVEQQLSQHILDNAQQHQQIEQSVDTVAQDLAAHIQTNAQQHQQLATDAASALQQAVDTLNGQIGNLQTTNGQQHTAIEQSITALRQEVEQFIVDMTQAFEQLAAQQ